MAGRPTKQDLRIRIQQHETEERIREIEAGHKENLYADTQRQLREKFLARSAVKQVV